MAIETGFYRNQQQEPPSMLNAVGKAVSLGELGVHQSRIAMEQQKFKQQVDDQNAMKAAYANNTDESGVLNRQKFLGDLGKAAPMKSLEVQGKFIDFDSKEAAYKRQQLDGQINQMGIAANLAMSAKDQPSYDKVLGTMQGMGLDTTHMPTEFDPGLMRRLAFTSAKQLERLQGQKQLFDEAVKRRGVDLNERKVDISERQGDRRNDILAARADAMNKGKSSNLVNQIRKERSQLPTTKATQEVAVAYNKVQQSAASESAAGDLSLIFGYMKMLDPGSVVREGEFATAQNATGVPQQIANLYNKVMTGERLAPEQRKDFLAQSHKVWKSQLSQQNKVDADYRRIAIKNNIDPRDVLLNFGADEPVDPNIERAKQMAGVGVQSEPAPPGGLGPILEVGPQRPPQPTAREAGPRVSTGATGAAPSPQSMPPAFNPAPQGQVTMRTPSGKLKYVPEADAQGLAAKGWSVIK